MISLAGSLFRIRAPDLTDMDGRKLLLATVDQVDHAAGNHDGGKDRRADADAVHNGKAADRTGTEDEKGKTRNQARHVRVETLTATCRGIFV